MIKDWLPSQDVCFKKSAGDQIELNVTKPYFIQGEESIQFDETMTVSEKNLGWNEFDILWMAIEMWPELNGFGDE